MAHILVVDDDDQLAEMMAEALVVDGHRVTLARSAASTQKALSELAAEEARVDLVVSDVVLPDGDGQHVVAAVRARQPGVPALYITGYGRAHDELRLAEGTVLEKPFRLSEFLDRVREMLGPQ